ncbi:MAG: ThaI family type II restriction endonuclease [Candidatus Stahlbacteria bacterium]|nr:ThaI family type II restriction endonuclease [Candidatus Stahlbacteria bacterium]
MPNRLEEIFEDEILTNKIKTRLPYLFQLAELESSRAGKIGMQVGSVRETIIVALLVHKFNEANVETEISITEAEVEVKLFGMPVSIKTITGTNFSGVKLIWTVDAQKAIEFSENYYPSCDMLFVQINWGGNGGFYYIPLAVQRELLDNIERRNYIKLPKAGTNPRGVEITKEAMLGLIENGRTKKIIINWQKVDIEFNPYKRWVELWSEE